MKTRRRRLLKIVEDIVSSIGDYGEKRVGPITDTISMVWGRLRMDVEISVL